MDQIGQYDRYGFSHFHFSLIASCLPDVTDFTAEEVTGTAHLMGRMPLSIVLMGRPRRLTLTLAAEMHELAGAARYPVSVGR
jgi:hypothetical protein